MTHVLSLRLAAMAEAARGPDAASLDVSGWADALEQAAAAMRRREQPAPPLGALVGALVSVL